MTKYIDREALCDFALNTADKSITPNDIMRFPTEDVISIEVYRQVMWERDTALNQLAEIGKSLGEKMDNIKPVGGKMTNADRIRAMTDEELALWLKDITCPYRFGAKVNCDIDNKGCWLCWLDWLKQEVEE